MLPWPGSIAAVTSESYWYSATGVSQPAAASHMVMCTFSVDSRLSSPVSTRTSVELAGLLFDGFSLAEAAEITIYPQYSNDGGVDSERTFVKQLVQKYCDDGTEDDLFNIEDESNQEWAEAK